MKKTLAVIAVSGVALWFGASYLSGSIAENETRKLVSQLNNNPDEYGVAQITSYERGVHNSTVQYQYKVCRYYVKISMLRILCC